MTVQSSIEQVPDLENFIASEFRAHLPDDVGDQIERLIFVLAELLSIISHRGNSAAANNHEAFLDLVERDICALNSEFVWPHLKFKQVVMALLLSFIHKARLNDSQRSSSKRQYTRKERLEVIKDIAPAITSALPVNSSRFAEEDGWQDHRAKNDASQNPKLRYVITRHRILPNMTTRLNNMHFLQSAGSPAGALAA